MTNYKSYNPLGDINTTAALHWSQDLDNNLSIPVSLQNSAARASFINDFDNKFGTRISVAFYTQDADTKNSFLKEIVEYSKKELNDLMGSDEDLSGLNLKLWASCILVCKYIDPRRNIPTNERENIFSNVLDKFAESDPIFRIGMQTSIPFCDLRNENYVLDGVPENSSIRK